MALFSAGVSLSATSSPSGDVRLRDPAIAASSQDLIQRVHHGNADGPVHGAIGAALGGAPGLAAGAAFPSPLPAATLTIIDQRLRRLEGMMQAIINHLWVDYEAEDEAANGAPLLPSE